MNFEQILEKISKNGVAYMLMENDKPFIYGGIVFASTKELCENFAKRINVDQHTYVLELPLGDYGLQTLGSYTSKEHSEAYLVDLDMAISKDNLFLCRNEKIEEWVNILKAYKNDEPALYFPIYGNEIKTDFDNNYMGYTVNKYLEIKDTLNNVSGYSLSILDIWDKDIKFDDSEVFNIDGTEVSLLELRYAVSGVLFDRRINEESEIESIVNSNPKVIVIDAENIGKFLCAKNNVIYMYNDDLAIEERIRDINKSFAGNVKTEIINSGSTIDEFINTLGSFGAAILQEDGLINLPAGFMLNDNNCVLIEDYVKALERKSSL